MTGLIFSPDGKDLILDCSNPAGTQFFLRKVKVNLSADELKQTQPPNAAARGHMGMTCPRRDGAGAE